MTQASANEQFMLELINKSRKASGLQPLAMDSDLNTAAELHTAYQISVNKLTHTGSGGTTAYTRMVNAGFDFNGSSTWGENVGWQSITGTSSYQDELTRIHDWLMNSPGHRANLLNGSFREVGLGFATGTFQGYNSAVVTEDFAKATGNAFVTGVAIDDKDGDRFYDVGEGLGSVTVTAVNSSTGAARTTTTGTAGGYKLDLAPGTYKLTFSASGYASTTSTVTIASSNVKLDWIDPSTGTTSPTTSPGSSTITGTSASETLTGTASNDTINGLAGNDIFKALGGTDTMIGGTGNDIFYVDSSTDVIREYTLEGTDKVYSSVDYTLSTYVENLTLTGTAAIDGTGTSLKNILTGNSAGNILSGLGGDDQLFGMAGNDRLLGGDGNDVLTGGTGTDTLTGGGGADKFDWNATAEAGKGTTRDVVTDFTRGSDKLDLSGIDARLDTTGNNAFSFIGETAFGGTDGQLRFIDGGSYAIVQGDTNGDKIADFEIRLEGVTNLSSTDFIL